MSIGAVSWACAQGNNRAQLELRTREDKITEVPARIRAAIVRLGLVRTDQHLSGQPLTGGVSSDIWRVDLPSGPVCAKRALHKLRVSDDWFAPVERAVKEAEFNRLVGRWVPGLVPSLIGYHEASGVLVSAYLPNPPYRLWKPDLASGRVDPEFAALVARRLAELVVLSRKSRSLRTTFYDPDLIRALRLDPYFAATAERCPDVREPLLDLVRLFEANSVGLVHGDVSPKNILVGPDGPVFLDAECANFGDPAFDAAFCLNHLFLKGLWNSVFAGALEAAADAFWQAYRNACPDHHVADRVSRYLPGLLLARVDGKSPVEYLTEEADKDFVRVFARARLQSRGPEDTEVLIRDWFADLATRQSAASAEQEVL